MANYALPYTGDALKTLLAKISPNETNISNLTSTVNSHTSSISSLQNSISQKLNTSDLLNKTYPVGSFYFSTNSTSPASRFGGTWTALTDSKFLLPAGSWNTTGGVSTHSHNQGTLKAMIGAIDSNTARLGYLATDRATTESYNISIDGATSSSGNITSSRINHSTAVRGSTETVSNLPPYRTVYCWYRTA